jgi:hypothetical protein
VSSSLDEARANVETQYKAAVQIAETGGQLTVVERALWSQMLALGRAMIALYFACRVHRARAVTYEHGGRSFELNGTATSDVGTRFGKVAFTRPTARPIDNPRRGARDFPVDRELGIASGFSLPATLVMVRLCAQVAFGSARATFANIFEWAPCSRTVLRMVDSVGEHAAEFLKQAPAPDNDGEILVVQADAKGVPMIGSAEYRRRRERRRAPGHATKRHARRLRRREAPRKRRRVGDKSKNAKMSVVGVVYTLRRMPDGTMEGPLNKRVIATLGGYEALFLLLRQEADKRGYGTKETFFLSDGAKVLWRLKDEHFPNAEGCIDWFHIVEKIWACGEAIHPSNRAAVEAWYAKQVSLLRRRGSGPVIANLKAALEATPKTGPGTKRRRKLLRKTYRHLLRHMPHMLYASLRRRDLDIATGAVEGAVRNVVRMRLDGPGMRWSQERAERVLQLRCILVNGQWDAFERYVTEREGGTIKLPSRPAPTVPHDAAPKKLKEAA